MTPPRRRLAESEALRAGGQMGSAFKRKVAIGGDRADTDALCKQLAKITAMAELQAPFSKLLARRLSALGAAALLGRAIP
eukprot:562786-Prymnesium_polylepis.1